MKAVSIAQYGSPEVLQLCDVEVPQPRAGELLIEVHACGLNPVDYKIREGHLRERFILPILSIKAEETQNFVSWGKNIWPINPSRFLMSKRRHFRL
jgi:hypothetical protein